jgi:1-deoxy-D-xylulose-5-phosphate synthase
MMDSKAILDGIATPQDVKDVPREALDELCAEIRTRLIETISETGGHLASNLGIVELTVALLRCFDPPKDRIVWDVGHQCYVYKMLTGRAQQMQTLRQMGGISGFPNPKESPYDTFVVGHSSTSVSAANGFAKAKKLLAEDDYTIAVIGDGALTGGLAYEGLSNAGRSNDRLIVVLNDNQMSIGDNVGFAARHLSSLRTRPRYVRFKNAVAAVFRHIPLIGKPLYKLLLTGKNSMKRAIYKDVSFFEDMGFYYVGPINGHDTLQICRAFETARVLDRPVVIHAETVKGKGYTFAEKDPGTYHGVCRFDPEKPLTPSAVPTFSSVFGEEIDALAKEDARIVGITAAMKHGTCMQHFAERSPSHCFDTGIAESHAVTFASGMAAGGLLPVFAVYSTFLQRSYDQLLNDTALMDNHIVLAIDRAGIVPGDGETHQGIYDVPFLTTVPHTTIYAPSTFAELRVNLRQALYDVTGIAAVRYPKGSESAALAALKPDYAPYTFLNDEGDTLVITYGRLLANVLEAADRAAETGVKIAVLKLNKIYPLPETLPETLTRYRRIIFAEESARRGGIGELLASQLLSVGYTGKYDIRAIEQPLPPCTTAQGMRETGLDADALFSLFAGDKA